MKQKVKILIFDFDGVIVDSGVDIANAVTYTLQHFGRPLLPREEIISYVGSGAENLIRACFKDCGDEIILKALPFYKNYYLEHCIVKTTLYPHIKETLEFFKEKKLALVTNKPEALTHKILEGFGIRGYFHVIIGPESVKELKPDPEGLRKVLQDLKEKPEDAIMVGDSYTDVEVGRRAGTFTCGVTYGLGDIERLKETKPDFLIDDIFILTELLT